ncbi:MAG: hypothetical protein N4A49_08900 [Marinifilaceae bacterium]|nr:hypothetical protein [Marinifilaceae bacterium]
MKAFCPFLLVATALFAACSPSYMSPTAYVDDIYYSPNEDENIKNSENVPYEDEQIGMRNQNLEISQLKLKEIPSDTIRSTIIEEDHGEYLGGFNGSELDKQDAERLRQTYPQGFGYYNNSGHNLSMWLAGDPDWNVYTDGEHYWWTPSWTNYNYYNSYNFSPMRYGFNMSYRYPYNYYSPHLNNWHSWNNWFDPYYSYGYFDPFFHNNLYHSHYGVCSGFVSSKNIARRVDYRTRYSNRNYASSYSSNQKFRFTNSGRLYFGNTRSSNSRYSAKPRSYYSTKSRSSYSNDRSNYARTGRTKNYTRPKANNRATYNGRSTRSTYSGKINRSGGSRVGKYNSSRRGSYSRVSRSSTYNRNKTSTRSNYNRSSSSTSRRSSGTISRSSSSRSSGSTRSSSSSSRGRSRR